MSPLHPAFDLASTAGLARHCRQCRQAWGRRHDLCCLIEWLDACMAPRFVSSVALLALLLLMLS